MCGFLVNWCFAFHQLVPSHFTRKPRSLEFTPGFSGAPIVTSGDVVLTVRNEGAFEDLRFVFLLAGYACLWYNLLTIEGPALDLARRRGVVGKAEQ